ncbi:hypothetical protein AgCh_007046 [Apium graveolens]
MFEGLFIDSSQKLENLLGNAAMGVHYDNYESEAMALSLDSTYYQQNVDDQETREEETSEALRFLETKLYKDELPRSETTWIHDRLIRAEKEHGDDPDVKQLLSEIRQLAYDTAEMVDNQQSTFRQLSNIWKILYLLSCGCIPGKYVPVDLKLICGILVPQKKAKQGKGAKVKNLGRSQPIGSGVS